MRFAFELHAPSYRFPAAAADRPAPAAPATAERARPAGSAPVAVAAAAPATVGALQTELGRLLADQELLFQKLQVLGSLHSGCATFEFQIRAPAG